MKTNPERFVRVGGRIVGENIYEPDLLPESEEEEEKQLKEEEK